MQRRHNIYYMKLFIRLSVLHSACDTVAIIALEKILKFTLALPQLYSGLAKPFCARDVLSAHKLVKHDYKQYITLSDGD